MDKKASPTICYKNPLKYIVWSERIENDILCKANHQKTEIAILISENGDIRTRNMSRNRNGCFLMLTGLISQEDIIILTVFSPNNRAEKYIYNLKVKLEMSALLSVIDSTTRQNNSEYRSHEWCYHKLGVTFLEHHKEQSRKCILLKWLTVPQMLVRMWINWNCSIEIVRRLNSATTLAKCLAASS